MALSCTISRIKPDIGNKIAIFFIAAGFDAHDRGWPSEYCRTVGYERNRICVASRWWKKFDVMFSRFESIPTCDGRKHRQTDAQTCRRTDILRQHSPRYAYRSSSKNERWRV